jgi:hypothetical protein
MTGDKEIKVKTGLEIKQEILDLLMQHMFDLRETKTLNPFDNYLNNARIEGLSWVYEKVLSISPTKNGG